MIAVNVRIGLGGASQTVNVPLLDAVRRRLEEDLPAFTEVNFVDNAPLTPVLATMELQAVVTDSPAKIIAELDRTIAAADVARRLGLGEWKAAKAAQADFAVAVAALADRRNLMPEQCKQVLELMAIPTVASSVPLGEAFAQACADPAGWVPQLLALAEQVASAAAPAALAALVEKRLDELPSYTRKSIVSAAARGLGGCRDLPIWCDVLAVLGDATHEPILRRLCGLKYADRALHRVLVREEPRRAEQFAGSDGDSGRDDQKECGPCSKRKRS